MRRSDPTDGQDGLVGQSFAMQDLRRRIARIGPSAATVLVLGERGTGKELVARSLHRASPRRDRPFIAVNCAALPSELLASELFGHERGAFTGAAERRAGLIASAEGGTLFLDEVGDMAVTAQAMFLRFLQEREVRAVGASRSVTVDVRVVAATNRDVERAVEERTFRADLLDRLREIVIEVPPLRDRAEDIPELVKHLVLRQSRRHGAAVRAVDDRAMRALRVYEWPGNVRELEHTVSRAIVLADAGVIRSIDLGLPDVQASMPNERHDTNLPTDARVLGGTGAPLTPRQRAALDAAKGSGSVRRADLMGRCAISREAARRDLAALVQAGLLVRSGAGRGSVYRPV